MWKRCPPSCKHSWHTLSSHPLCGVQGGDLRPQTKTASPWRQHRGAAGRMPYLVVLRSPGQEDLRQFLCRSHPVMAAVTSPASCRAAAGRPARALGQLEPQLCLAGDTAHPRVGWRDAGMGVSSHLTESFPRMLLGKHRPAPAQAWGDLSMWWQGQEFWNSQRRSDVDVKPLSRIKDLPWFLFSEKSPFQSCSGAETTQHPTDLVRPSSPVPHFGMGSSWGRSRHRAHSQWRMCKETRHP